MSKREAELLRWWDLREEKRRLEREMRIEAIEREMNEILPPWDGVSPLFKAAA